MSKRSILFVITKGNWGGAQKYIFDMATGLSPDDFGAEVVFGEGDILPQRLSEAGIPSSQISELGRDISLSADLVSFLKLIRIFRKKRPDVVHLNSSKIGGLGALAARIAGISKIVFTVHGFAFNEDRPGWQKKLIRFVSWLSLLFSTDVICITKADCAVAKSWPLIRKKLHIVPNGIGMPIIVDRPLARAEIARLCGKPELFFNGKTVIGTIAELTRNKGLDSAIEAMANIENNCYVIIGGGEDRAKLEKIIAEKNLGDRVFITGFVPEASRLLSGFDIFLLPSLKEGLPYVLIEAGYAGLPVVATSVGGIPDIIDDGISGILINPNSPKDLQGALVRLIGNKNLQNEFGSALRARAKEQFTQDRMVAETVDIYR